MDVDISMASAARRMMQMQEQILLRHKDPKAVTKRLKQLIDEDEALLSGKPCETSDCYSGHRAAEADTVQVKLSELIEKLHNLQPGSQDGQPAEAAADGNGAAAAEAMFFHSVATRPQLKMSYRALPRVVGLGRRDAATAETDRYLFQFSDLVTFKITDKWTGRSTTIWGDPHVDTDDQEGALNGEFSDLKGSNTHTTLQLMDGTRVTFTALDNGVIETADIFNGSQHLRGYGGAHKGVNNDTAYFSGAVDSQPGTLVPLGDVVTAGGDGNDWYAGGKLLWGRTTGPVVTTRPSSVLELEYQHTVVEHTLAVTRNIQA